MVLQATGAVPRVIGEWQPPERSIPAAAAALPASLVILGVETEMAGSMARAIAGSVLVLPSRPNPTATAPTN